VVAVGAGGVATGALVLLGLGMPRNVGHLAAAHGLLMALGFLGTMIALERAVALGATWAYLAPLAAGLAAICLVLGVTGPLPGVLFLVGGLTFVAMYVAFDRIEVALHTRGERCSGRDLRLLPVRRRQERKAA